MTTNPHPLMSVDSAPPSIYGCGSAVIEMGQITFNPVGMIVTGMRFRKQPFVTISNVYLTTIYWNPD